MDQVQRSADSAAEPAICDRAREGAAARIVDEQCLGAERDLGIVATGKIVNRPAYASGDQRNVEHTVVVDRDAARIDDVAAARQRERAAVYGGRARISVEARQDSRAAAV